MLKIYNVNHIKKLKKLKIPISSSKINQLTTVDTVTPLTKA